ncbi:hypothetical protein ACVWXL_005747 [Bradyrhizobium sp. GM22.5]
MLKNVFETMVGLLVAWTLDQHFAAGWCTEAVITLWVQLRQAFG